ncbi:MAG: Inner membrane ABC transporter permease protein YejB [Chloroflexi bacterium ADurb.Bin325]|nr:MAG: Inner membrane ABC transporter permease protein YejB [Chloroflexi bacterium ADurb.Bin325]
MRFVKRYLIPRLIQYVGVTWLGITMIFFLPRLMPIGPVEKAVAQIEARGAYTDPKAAEQTILALKQMYGLDKGLAEQYLNFWRRLFAGDFGPSLVAFPTPVNTLIATSLPWTIGLLLTTTVLVFILGNLSGGLAGHFRQSRIMKVLDGAAMILAPMPYYIVALMLIILFAYIVPRFPVGGAYTIGAPITFSPAFIKDVLWHAFLPALSLVALGVATTHQIMRLIVQGVNEEDYVRYARIGAVSSSTIFTRYIMRNAMLPQITRFAMGFAGLFSGALITEVVFAYPGIGFLAYRAIQASDYNVLMGITTLSIIALTTSTLIMDLLNPLFDPRIRLT